MADPTQGWPRVARCALLAAVVVTLAAAAHVLGGGAAPSTARLLALTGLALGPCAWLTGRRLCPLALLAIVGVGQVGLHELLMAADHASMTGMHGTAGIAAMTRVAGMSEPVVLGGMSMMLTYAGAAAVTALMLAHGERAAWELLLILLPRPQLLQPLRLPVPAVPAIPSPDVHQFVPFLGVVAAHVLRGPPD